MKPFIFLFVFILFVGVRVQYSSSLREGKDISFRQLSRSSKLQGQSSLCFVLIEPAGYPCSEHSVKTKDGYVLALQRVSSDRKGHLQSKSLGPPVVLQHGLFMGGDSWFLNSKEQSLGYILADQGFDVWVANVRGTQWSHGHVSLSVENTTTTTITSCSTWHWHQSEVKVLHFSSDGAYLYSGGKEGVLVVWQLDTGKKRFLPRIGSPLVHFTGSPDPTLSSATIGIDFVSKTMYLDRTVRLQLCHSATWEH
ncbi:hypothetical protein MKW94_011163 [Papaver nudicaule]|uniref:Partial AB-hydrolase lipase domain-containing protein n=1 Tax=Papaver nudicaule TaxID=74823 RepID=A0AA41VGG8_PAPNU|nr:hypothetical protein [Papaver nudicaule]